MFNFELLGLVISQIDNLVDVQPSSIKDNLG